MYLFLERESHLDFLIYSYMLNSLSKWDTPFSKTVLYSSLEKKNHSLALDLSIAVFLSATLQRKVGARPLIRIMHNSKISSGHSLEFLF